VQDFSQYHPRSAEIFVGSVGSATPPVKVPNDYIQGYHGDVLRFSLSNYSEDDAVLTNYYSGHICKSLFILGRQEHQDYAFASAAKG
jgi:predicted GH43/DUF377 family glycosyl hydrolase